MVDVDGSDRGVVFVGTELSDGDLEGAFERAGFGVSSVGSAAAGFESVAEGEADALVTRQNLRDTTGVDLVRAVRMERPNLAVVLAPASGSETLAARAVRAGVDAYVPSDADPATAVERVRETIGTGSAPEVGESERRYRHLVETSPAPINLFDADGTCVWGNDAVLDLLGLASREELVGRSIFEFIDPADRDLAEAELRAVVERKQSTGPTRMTLVRADGERREVRVSTAPGTYGGRDIGQAVIVDVTSLLAAKQTLRNERRFIQKALDTLDDLFFVVDPAGELVRWNERVTELTGLSGEALAERGIEEFFADEDADRALAAVRGVLEGDAAGRPTQLDVRTADGRTVPYEFRSRRITDDAGEVVGMVGVGRDISDQRERERQFQVLEKLLRHTIRTDLNFILGLAEQIEVGDVDDVRSAARRIRESGQRLFERADKVKQLVQMLTGPTDLTTVDLVAVVEQQAAAARKRHPAATVEVSGESPVRARTSPRLGAAIGELIENAIRHSSEPSPTVAVDVDGGEDAATLTIEDDGPEIPPLERELLTDEREITQLEHGEGVGLWFVYWVVRRSDGRIAFENCDSDGNTIRIELPTGA